MGEIMEPGPVIMRYQGKKQRLHRSKIFQEEEMLQIKVVLTVQNSTAFTSGVAGIV